MFGKLFITATFSLLTLSANAIAADGQPWQIVRTSGQVWLAKSDVQPVSLTTGGAELQAGDQITTGNNGRVLLVRGEERIEMAPGTSISLPKDLGPFPTSITQRFGTITLDVEKKNVQHFEVGTPHMAAVVKGTQFSVTVTRDGTEVGVSRGQVQVSDFKTGQIGDILPGQAARVSLSGTPGIKLSGSGTFLPITQGAPRLPPVGTQASKPDGAKSDTAKKDGGKEGAKSAFASAPATDKASKITSEAKPARQFNHARNGNVRGQDAVQSDGSPVPMNIVGGAGGGSGGGAAPASNSGSGQGSAANNVGNSANAGLSGSGGRGGSNVVSSVTDGATTAITNGAAAAAISSLTNTSVGSTRDDDGSSNQSGKSNSGNSGNSNGNSQSRNSNGNGNGNGNGSGNGNGNLNAALKGKKS